MAEVDGAAPRTPAAERAHSLRTGPGVLLVTLYAIFAVGATSRSGYQLATRWEQAPVAYLLSALAAGVYVVLTLCLVRGGRAARQVAVGCCVAELVGVLTVGTWTWWAPAAFPDATVWSDYGRGYVFLPLVLPVVGLYWLRRRSSGA